MFILLRISNGLRCASKQYSASQGMIAAKLKNRSMARAKQNKAFCYIIMTLSILGITTSPLDAGISKTTTFTLSVTLPERSELPSSTSVNSPASDPLEFDDREYYLQNDIRDNQDVYLVSFVTD